MAGITLLDRQEAVRDLESRLRRALLITRLSGEQLVSRHGRLMILRPLGYGASGVVCEALDRKLGRKVALKLYPGLAQDALAQAVRTEAQVLAALRHRNIVVVHDFDADEFRPGDLRCFFVVMELLSGTTLRHWMATSHPVSEILDVFCRAGDGLAAAHAGGIVHRDFKPENVMLDTGGEPRLVDFGLATLDTPAGQLDGRNPDQRSIVGTLAYMAPEALRGRAVPRSDQFSFAAALWEALYGEFPYTIDDLDPARRVVSKTPRSPPGLPVAIFDCLRRALDADPNRRFSSINELVARLRELQGELRSASSTASAPAMLANVNLSSDTHRSPATAAAPVVPRRSWGWLAFPAFGAVSIIGVLAASGFWSVAAPAPPEDDPAPISTGNSGEDPGDPPQPPPTPADPRREIATGKPLAEPSRVDMPFLCRREGFDGVWLFKDTFEQFSLELRMRNSKSCKFAATLKTESRNVANNDLKIEAFSPHAGVALGKFLIDGITYEPFLVFDTDKLHGHMRTSGTRQRKSLLFGGRKDEDRQGHKATKDYPCAALCAQCTEPPALGRCREMCSEGRETRPRCGSKSP